MEGLDELSIMKIQSRFDHRSTIVSLSSMSTLKNNVIDYYQTLSKGHFGWIYGSIGSRSAIYTPEQFNEMKKQMVPVSEVIWEGLKKSGLLIVAAFLISLVLGTIKGVFDSKKGKKNDSSLKLISTLVGLSIPDISIVWILQAAMILLTRALDQKYLLLPLSGDMGLKYTIMPIITLSILPTMYVARITSMAIDHAYNHDCIRTAISKGSSPLRVIWIHAYRNAVVEVVGSIPSIITTLISNLVIVEYLYYYKGLTFLMMDYYDKGESDAVTGIAITLYGIYLVFYLLSKLTKYTLDSKGRRSTL